MLPILPTTMLSPLRSVLPLSEISSAAGAGRGVLLVAVGAVDGEPVGGEADLVLDPLLLLGLLIRRAAGRQDQQEGKRQRGKDFQILASIQDDDVVEHHGALGLVEHLVIELAGRPSGARRCDPTHSIRCLLPCTGISLSSLAVHHQQWRRQGRGALRHGFADADQRAWRCPPAACRDAPAGRRCRRPPPRGRGTPRRWAAPRRAGRARSCRASWPATIITGDTASCASTAGPDSTIAA